MSSVRDDWHIRDIDDEPERQIEVNPFEERLAEILYDERGGRVPRYNCKVYAKELSKDLLKLAKKVLKEKEKHKV